MLTLHDYHGLQVYIVVVQVRSSWSWDIIYNSGDDMQVSDGHQRHHLHDDHHGWLRRYAIVSL